ncbi:MAG TPA: hypothetical protein PKW95_09160 [bacterium]|nr:hypothetical protein [bacterium]
MNTCPNCGHKIEAGENRCPSCGAIKAKKIAVDARLADNGKVEMTPSNCEACGAEMQYDPVRRMFVCPYCSAVSVLDPPPEALTQEPPGYLPFTVPFHELKRIVKAKTWFINIDPERPNPKRAVKIRRLYLPYLLAKGIGSVDYTYLKTSQLQFAKTDDRYLQEFEDFKVPLFDIAPYRKRLLGPLSTLPINNIVPVNDSLEKLCDQVIPATDGAQAKIDAETVLKKLTLQDFRNHLSYKASVQKTKASVKQLSTRTIYLPLWEVQYKDLFGWPKRLLISGLIEDVEAPQDFSIHPLKFVLGACAIWLIFMLILFKCA